LGLHISRRIVELLGGEITVCSEPDKGSTFSFVIPWREALPDVHDPSPRIAGYQGPRQKILVVDDEPLNRSMLRELPSTVGFDAAETDSPEQALSLIKKRVRRGDLRYTDARLRWAYILQDAQIVSRD
jgi:Histidine kinase-, DNA gyrase B-, and HSP90-like ATPase